MGEEEGVERVQNRGREGVIWGGEGKNGGGGEMDLVNPVLMNTDLMQSQTFGPPDSAFSSH